MKENKGFYLRTVKAMNIGTAVSGVGFLLYLGASAMGWETLSDVLAIAFGLVSLYVFLSVSEGRRRDKEAVSYNLLWGAGALALLLCGCAVLTVRLRLTQAGLLG